MSKFIASFRTIPKELFRLNNGRVIRLRDKAARKSTSYDVITVQGRVLPKALDQMSYKAPNGASLRPNTVKQKDLVDSFEASDVVVYRIPEGVKLPENLILVHERNDHYSLQAAQEMALEDLNESITSFLNKHATPLTKQEWQQRYPVPTETS